MALLNSVEAWIAIGVSMLFLVAGVVMHRVFINVLKKEPIAGSDKPQHD
jgi:hypothetical protein